MIATTCNDVNSKFIVPLNEFEIDNKSLKIIEEQNINEKQRRCFRIPRISIIDLNSMTVLVFNLVELSDPYV